MNPRFSWNQSPVVVVVDAPDLRSAVSDLMMAIGNQFESLLVASNVIVAEKVPETLIENPSASSTLTDAAAFKAAKFVELGFLTSIVYLLALVERIDTVAVPDV